MRNLLWALLLFVVFLPLACVLLLFAAAKRPAMDSFTLKMPLSVRQVVAESALNTPAVDDKAYPAKIARVLRLDPENIAGWSKRCLYTDHTGLAVCRKAVQLDRSAPNLNGLGLAQQETGDFCAAEDSFTAAIGKQNGNADYVRNMASAALRCGHLPASGAGFEVAEDLDAKQAADTDADDKDLVDDAKADLRTDREYLTIVYDRMNQPAKSREACTHAHPGWKSCHCDFTATDIKCSGGPPSQQDAPSKN